MPRRKKQPVAETSDDIVIGATISGDASAKSSLAGKVISINLKRNSYFGVGDIWLTPENYWATIPEGMPAQDYEIIYNALLAGKIVSGKKFIPPIDKASNTPEEYWKVIAKSGFKSQDARKKFTSLIRKGTDDGWTAIEIAQFCLDKENSGAKRNPVVNTLTQLIKNYNGPIQLYDPPDDKEGIKKVTVKADGTVEAETHSGKKVAKTMKTPPPEGHKAGNKTAQQALNELD